MVVFGDEKPGHLTNVKTSQRLNCPRLLGMVNFKGSICIDFTIFTTSSSILTQLDSRAPLSGKWSYKLQTSKCCWMFVSPSLRCWFSLFFSKQHHPYTNCSHNSAIYRGSLVSFWLADQLGTPIALRTDLGASRDQNSQLWQIVPYCSTTAPTAQINRIRW